MSYTEIIVKVGRTPSKDRVCDKALARPGALVSHIDGKPVGGRAPDGMRRLQDAYRRKMLAETAK